jgi:ASC-1-like (ASCH) protein
MLSFSVQDPHFSNIKAGKKTIEGRLNKTKFAALKKTILLNGQIIKNL